MTARKIGEHWYVDFWAIHQHGPHAGERERIRQRSTVNTKRGAEEFERLLRERILYGKPLDGSDPAVVVIPAFEDWMNEFLDTYCETNTKPSVRKERRCIARLHLVPFFGRTRIDLIGPREIEKFKARVLETGVSAKRLKNILAVLSRMLRYAEEVGIIEHAPRVRMPKIPPTKFDFLSDDELARLLQAASYKQQNHAMVLIGADAGLRKGEIVGMEWGDVDFHAHHLTVRRSVWREDSGESFVDSPKSGRDRRIPMTSRLEHALRAHRHLRGDRIFCNDDGTELRPGQLEVALRTSCRRAGLRQVGWHTLRHTFASHLAQRGGSPKVIMELLGHADLTTTLRYLHLSPVHHREAIALLEDPRGAKLTVVQ